MTRIAITPSSIDNLCAAALLNVKASIALDTLRAMEALDLHEDVLLDAQVDADCARWQAEAFAQECERELAERQHAEFCATHTWVQALDLHFPGSTGIDRARRAIAAYLRADWDATFGYDCSSNPEGIAQIELNAARNEDHHLMHAALSCLTDSEIESALHDNTDWDFDGGRFPVTTVQHVRWWAANVGTRVIAHTH